MHTSTLCKLFWICMASIMLFSCQHSPKKNYYLLSSSASDNSQKSAPMISTLVGIGPVEITDYLDRLRIIYQTDDNSVVVSDNDYWAEPLDKGIARVIAENLVVHNNTRTFVTFPWRGDSIPHYSLRLQIQSLHQNMNEASMNVTWEIFDNTKKISIERHRFIQSTPSQNNPKALAQAYSKLLVNLANDIDTALNNLH